MAKTQFIDNTELTPAFMATQSGTDATTGHAHTGLDADGSQPKVETEYLSDTTWTFTAKMRAADTISTPTEFTWTYRVSGDRKVTIHIVESLELSNSYYCQFEPSAPATWPAAIIPSTEQFIPVIVANAQSYTTILSPGLIQIPALNSTNMILWCMDPDESSTNIVQAQDFSNSTSVYKGLMCQTISYYLD